MPLQPGSTTAMPGLYEKYHIVIATSRPVETQAATIAWLNKNFKFHEFANTRQVGKAALGLDLLVDDSLENTKNFASTKGVAILYSQPWNRSEDSDLKMLIANRKLIRCEGWPAVVEQIGKLHLQGR